MNSFEVLRLCFSNDFIEKMKNRILVSTHKYGLVQENVGRVDMLKSLEVRIDKYRDTGNKEHLVDIANFAMFEFMFPMHPRAHYRATDSDESAGVVGRHAKTRD